MSNSETTIVRFGFRAANWLLGGMGIELRKRPVIRPDVWSHKRSPDYLHTRVAPLASYAPWLSDAVFERVYQLIKGYTLVDQYRCYELWSLAHQTKSVPGSILEVGVWRGGTGCLLALASPHKTVYLADTFTGVVKAGDKDTNYFGAEHADTSEDIVSELLAKAGATNCRLLKGIFPEDTASQVDGPIALLHVDVDVYQSGRDVVAWALPRMGVGSIIVFDDYGFYGCEGITRLVNELRDKNPDFCCVHNLNGHAVMIRTHLSA